MSRSVSPRCQIVLEKGVTKDVCYDFRRIRAYVMCKAWKIMEEEKVPFRSAIKRAWDEAKRECAEAGALV